MGVNLEDQAVVFGLVFLCGAAVGVLFDIFRILRREVGAGARLTNVLDALFWVLAAILSSLWLYTVNDGELRWFEFLALAAGAGIYFAIISPALVFVVRWVIGIIKKVVLFVIKVLLLPARAVFRLLHRTFIIICVPLKSIKRFIKRRRDSLVLSVSRFKKRVKKV